MKKLILLFSATFLLLSCEQEQTIIESSISVDQKLQTATNVQGEIDRNKYFGVFVTVDLELHGEIRIDLQNDVEFQAVVKLLNSEILKFKAYKTEENSEVVNFIGNRGSFTIDFTNKRDIRASNFLVDGKPGHIKAYEQRLGIAGTILFGTYVDDLDSGFTGVWDAITGGPDPFSFLPLIDDIVITHMPSGAMFTDESPPGTYEFFIDTFGCVFFWPGPIFSGGVTDGFVVAGIDQVAIFDGVPTTWTMAAVAGIPAMAVDPLLACAPLPPGIHGFWSRGTQTGTITNLGPMPWL